MCDMKLWTSPKRHLAADMKITETFPTADMATQDSCNNPHKLCSNHGVIEESPNCISSIVLGELVKLYWTSSYGQWTHTYLFSNYQISGPSEDSDAIHLVRASHIIWREIFANKYAFSGTFNDGCEEDIVPHTLKALVSMIIEGPTIKD